MAEDVVTDRELAEAWALLEALVVENSHTRNVAGCNRVCTLLQQAFDMPGLQATRVSRAAVGDHVCFSTARYAAGHRDVVLVGHHDTVFPPGVFEGFRRDATRAYGPGVLDMKGGLMVIRTALAALARRGTLMSLGLAVVSISDEETGSMDGGPWLAELAQGARMGLVFEAGRVDDSLVVARKGTGSLRVTMHGVAAHAGNDFLAGKNAIVAMARFVVAAAALSAPAAGVTVNIGLIEGGTSTNTVPAQARCELDLRVVTEAQATQLLQELTAAATTSAAAVGARVELEGGLRRWPLEASAASLDVMARYAAHAQAVGLGAARGALVGGGSDANTLARLGVPVIDGLGPRGAKFHTPDEYIESATLAARSVALATFLEAFAAEGLGAA